MPASAPAHRHLFNATFRVRSRRGLSPCMSFFQSRGFIYVNTPIITGSDCEGAGEMFQRDDARS